MTAQRIAPRTLARLDKPLTGRQAQIAANQVQAPIWDGLSSTERIVDSSAVAELVDARGDAIRARIWRHEDAAIAALVAIIGPSQAVRDALAELYAARGLRIQYEEAEAYDDEHRRDVAGHGIEVNGALHRANGGVGVLLGQGEAVCDDLPLHPLSLCSIGGTDA